MRMSDWTMPTEKQKAEERSKAQLAADQVYNQAYYSLRGRNDYLRRMGLEACMQEINRLERRIEALSGPGLPVRKIW
jgi:hypothetical protein